jgi:hypothetical protein
MLARVFRSGVAALTGIAGTLVCVACSLTTDLSGFSEGALASEGGPAPPNDGAVVVDGSSSGALPDSADAADPSTAYAAVVLADGPVAYYRFEDPSDANFAKDSVGTHNANATAAGVKFGGPGLRGGGATFDGTASLDVGDVFDFAGKQPFTLELWLRSSGSQVEGELIHKRDQNVDPFKGYILYANTGSPHFEAWGVDLNAYSDAKLSSTFSYVVVTVAYGANGKGNATIYVNAQPGTAGGYDNVLDLADTPAPLRFGLAFTGVLDEIALYDKALPNDRILEHYRAGR